jgi:hypothetical protein
MAVSLRRTVCGLLILLVLLFALWVVTPRPAAPWTTPRELLPEWPDVAPEANGYSDVATASTDLGDTQLGLDFLDSRTNDVAAVRAWLGQHADARQRIEECLARGHYVPPRRRLEDRGECNTVRLQSVYGLLAVSARVRRLDGDVVEAVRSAASAIRLGRLVVSQPSDIYEFMLGVKGLSLGLAEARMLAVDARTATTDLGALSEVLAAIAELRAGMAQALKRGLAFVTEAVQAIGTDKVPFSELLSDAPNENLWRVQWFLRPHFFDANATCDLIAEQHAELIRCIALPYAEANSRLASIPVPSEPEGPALVAGRNAIGRTLASSIVPAVGKSLRRACEVESDIAATRIIVALNRYRRQEGRWPLALHELVPAFLDAVPNDPFDGLPFRYAPAKGIVYSVGEDLVDDGGSAPPPLPGRVEPGLGDSRKASDLVYWFVLPEDR